MSGYDVDGAAARASSRGRVAASAIYLEQRVDRAAAARTRRARSTSATRLRANPHRIGARDAVRHARAAPRADRAARSAPTPARSRWRRTRRTASTSRRSRCRSSAGDVVLSPDREFPGERLSVDGARERRGVEYRRLPCDDGVLDDEALLRARSSGRRCARVTVSWVQFASGSRVDLAALGRALPRARHVLRRRRDSGARRRSTLDVPTPARRHPRVRRAEVAALAVGRGLRVRATRADAAARAARRELAGRARRDDFSRLDRLRSHLARRRAALRVHHAAVTRTSPA